MSLQESLVAPIPPGAATDVGVTRIDIDQPATDATDCLIGEVAHNLSEHIECVETGRVREHNNFAAGLFDAGVLGRSLAKSLWLAMQDYALSLKRMDDFIGAIAIDEAFLQYNALYAMLVRKVLSDPELIAAAKG